MPKTVTGEKITWGEAGKRFKQGVNNMTPVQKLKTEIRGTFISLLGFTFSFIAVIWKGADIGLLSYGLMLIFLGSIINTGLKFLGSRQQLRFFKNTEENSVGIDKLNEYLEEDD